MLLLLLGCAEAEGPPSLSILTPSEGDTVCGTPLSVVVEVTGFTLVDPESGGEEEGTGHVDVMLNGQDALMTGAEAFVVEDVVDGEVQLKVELSGADHEPVEPYAGDYVYVTVAEAACS